MVYNINNFPYHSEQYIYFSLTTIQGLKKKKFLIKNKNGNLYKVYVGFLQTIE